MTALQSTTRPPTPRLRRIEAMIGLIKSLERQIADIRRELALVTIDAELLRRDAAGDRPTDKQEMTEL